jgi:dolichol-phosphate mannosyltransferase
MKPLISVIVPLYNEELVIKECYSRLTEVLGRSNLTYEIVMVNDGSRDSTLVLAGDFFT